MSPGLEVSLAGDVDASAVARRALELHGRALPQSVRDDLSLLVTELVTNAVRHGGAGADSPLRMELQRRNGHIRVQVTDPGTGFESSPAAGAGTADGGWGLFLVDQIADSWGVLPAPRGTCVWFEVPVAPVAPA